MKIYSRLLWLVAILSLTSCTPPPRYDGLYVDRDSFYKNYDIGMTMRFSGKWIVQTDPRRMNRSARSFARDLRIFGSDLLFSGVTADGNQAVRCIVENANLGAREYADEVRKANKAMQVHKALPVLRVRKAR